MISDRISLSDKSSNENMNNSNIRFLNGGIWAERLRNGDQLPVGGSMFSDNPLSDDSVLKLELDFNSFEKDLKNFTFKTLSDLYDQNKLAVDSWLKESYLIIDPFLYYLFYQVQNKVFRLLSVDNSKSVSYERFQKFSKGQTPKLSGMINLTECAEQAALGQFLLERIGLKSVYMSGITMNNAQDKDEYPSKHSFLVMDLKGYNDTFIFDIAKPKSNSIPTNSTPRVLQTDIPISYDLLKQFKDEAFIGATDVLGGKPQNSDEIIRTRLYYGVGDEVAGSHRVLDKTTTKNI
jgi:hypothetical protein